MNGSEKLSRPASNSLETLKLQGLRSPEDAEINFEERDKTLKTDPNAITEEKSSKVS